MPLQIAERAVVGEHVEPVAGPLERAARLVAAVARDRRRRRAARPRDRPADIARAIAEQLIVGQRGRRVERGGDDLDLAVGIEVGERDLVARLRRSTLVQRTRGGVRRTPRASPRGTRLQRPPRSG